SQAEALETVLSDALDTPPALGSDAEANAGQSPEQVSVPAEERREEGTTQSEAATPATGPVAGDAAATSAPAPAPVPVRPLAKKHTAPLISVSVGGSGARKNRKVTAVTKTEKSKPVQPVKTSGESSEKPVKEEFSLVGLKAEDIVPDRVAAADTALPTPRDGETARETARPAPAAAPGKEEPARPVDAAGEPALNATPETAPESAAPKDTRETEASDNAGRSGSARELPLLDMIITDEDMTEEDDVLPAAHEEGSAYAQTSNEADAPSRPSPTEAVSAQTPAVQPVAGNIPLPGENDSVSTEMLPFIPGLLYEMDDALKDARQGIADKSSLLVQEASKRLADKASAFNLQVLERVSRCVERAAAADDLEAVGDLFAELEQLTLRYKEALRRCHQNASW
ncbi:hypothetical protein LJC23_00215, partial [Desulfovibrio sp. OttesenSCG-928-I05]|nr:hypothetical protein [Desulfovibrio sp. OttesenSCG-928-I05]